MSVTQVEQILSFESSLTLPLWATHASAPSALRMVSGEVAAGKRAAARFPAATSPLTMRSAEL